MNEFYLHLISLDALYNYYSLLLDQRQWSRLSYEHTEMERETQEFEWITETNGYEVHVISYLLIEAL